MEVHTFCNLADLIYRGGESRSQHHSNIYLLEVIPNWVSQYAKIELGYHHSVPLTDAGDMPSISRKIILSKT